MRRPGGTTAGVLEIVPQSQFTFITNWALRQAARTTDYLSLMVVKGTRQVLGVWVEVTSIGLIEAAETIARSIRSTDLIGELAEDEVAILMPKADETGAARILDRISDALGNGQFPLKLALSVGVAIYPTHGLDVPALTGYAISHPILNIHTRTHTIAQPDLALTR